MRFQLFIISLTLSLASQAQKKTIVNSSEINDYKVFTKVELNSGPENPQHWNKYLEKIVKIPDSIASQITPGKYPVKVQFIVDTHGSIGQVKVVNQVPSQLLKLAISAIRNYPGGWKAASHCGRLVKSYHEETLLFVIADH